MANYSTKQVAAMVGVHPNTIHRWQQSGKLRASGLLKLNGQKLWLWSDEDVRAIRRYKKANYWQGGGRKKKP